ncbi:MAG: recombinase family protein [Patescibacteria group bacterium]
MKYLAYCRKSSESEERQMLSIDAQVNEIRVKAAREGIILDKVFCESMSAKAPGRPVFQEMIEYVQKNKPCTLYVWKLDRLARNPIDGGTINWLLQQNIIHEIKTHDKNYYPADNVLLMSFEFGMANQFVRDLSVNVKRGNLEKLRQGGWPHMAPFGYLNDKADHTVYPDPERAHYVEKMFKLYATGSYGLKEIAQMMYDQGLRTKGGGKVSHSIIHMIFKNPFYYGVMESHGKYYPGKHPPIISKELFDQTQIAVNKRQHTHKEKYEFVHRGFMYCHNCGCQLTASLKKGHTYYYCTNGKKSCEQHKKYLREEKVDDLVAETLNKLQIDSELIEIAYLAKKENLSQAVEYTQTSVESIQKQLASVRQKLAKLLDSYLGNLIPEDVYTDKIQALNNERVTLEQQQKTIQENQPADPLITLERIKSIFLVANQAKKDFLKAKENEKRNLLEILLWNLSVVNEKIADVSFKMPYELIAKTTQKGDFAALQGR